MTGIPITPSQPVVAMTSAEIAALKTTDMIPGFTILEQESGIMYVWTGKILTQIPFGAGNRIVNSSQQIDISMLRKWMTARAKVLGGTGGAKIVCVGDSTTIGTGSGGSAGTRSASWPTKLAARLSSLGLPAKSNSITGLANNTIANFTSLVDTRFTIGAGWSSNVADNARQCLGGVDLLNTTTTNPIEFVVADSFDKIDIYYFKNTGTFTVNVDGGATLATVNCSTGLTGTQVGKTTVSCSLANHTINIARASGQVDICGIVAYNDTTKEVQIVNAGISGAGVVNSGGPSTDWLYANAGGPYGWDRMTTGTGGTWGVWAPDLTIITLTTNDSLQGASLTTYKNNLSTVVDAAKTAGDVLMIVGFPYDTGVNTTSYQMNYWSMVKAIAAEKSCLCLDIPARWGTSAYNTSPVSTLYSDQYHPTGAGYADIGNILGNILLA